MYYLEHVPCSLVEVAASSWLRWAQAIISCCTLLSKDPAAFSSRPSHTMEFEGILFVVAVLALLAVPWQDWGQVIWTSLKIKHVQKNCCFEGLDFDDSVSRLLARCFNPRMS